MKIARKSRASADRKRSKKKISNDSYLSVPRISSIFVDLTREKERKNWLVNNSSNRDANRKSKYKRKRYI